jgi:arabinogalactan endo-1,4-beta-galactosidase
MKTKILILIAAAMPVFGAKAQKYVGGDISLLPEYENANAVYLDNSGNDIASPLTFFKEQGLNAMRVRLFVSPDKYTGSDKDANACQDLAYVKTLGKRIKDAGFSFMLDFHYSDTWADPTKQWTPADWASLTDEQLYQKIYDYTKDVLSQLKAAGATPDMIQPGNEVSYGMLWGTHDAATSSLKKCYSTGDANWDRFKTLLTRAIAACREECPNAKIILHSERVAQYTVLSDFLTRLSGVDYDVIGLSYYPYFHGALSVLENTVSSLTTNYPDKEIMIVETGYPYAWEVPGTTFDYKSTYAYSEAGQASYTEDLVKVLNRYQKVTGLFWWWMEYNAYSTSLTGWYNAPLFDSRSGKALSALSALKDFAPSTSTGINNITVDSTASNSLWFNLQGQQISEPSKPGLYINNGKKVIIK